MTGQRVLVVEDDERSAELLRYALEPTGVAVEQARTVEEGRRAIERGLPAAILLDLRLPDGGGHTLARDVRAAPDGGDVYILAVSASIRQGDRDVALESGCDDFMEKPISPRELVLRLRRRLEPPR